MQSDEMESGANDLCTAIRHELRDGEFTGRHRAHLDTCAHGCSAWFCREVVQIAIVEGAAEKYREHIGQHDECAWFAQLSRSVLHSKLAVPPGHSGPLGPFAIVLREAHEKGEPILGRYRLDHLLGNGGQGQVWAATDLESDEELAVKFVRLDGDTGPGGSVETAIEVVNARKVNHPNICRVYHTERHGTVRLIVMERIRGVTLDKVLSGLDRAAALRCFRKICEGVAACHAAGVLHLDLKPSNVIVRANHEPVVTDFGLSVRASAVAISRGGTEMYMAPEQRSGQGVDERTDVRALGLILAQMLHGSLGEYSGVVARATDDRPERRFASVARLVGAVDQARNRRRLAAATAVAAVLCPALALGAPAVRRWIAGVPSGALIISGSAGGAWNGTVEAYDQDSNRLIRLPDVPDRSLCRSRALRGGDGQIRLIGGGGPAGCSDDGTTTNGVRSFQPDTGQWTVAACQAPCMLIPGHGTFALQKNGEWRPADCRPEGPCLAFGRNNTTALTLANGDLFALGGCAGGCAGPNALQQRLTMRIEGERVDVAARTAEIFEIGKGMWRITPPSHEPHVAGSAAQLGGFVFVCGGSDGYSTVGSRCESFDLNSHFNGAPPWIDQGLMPRKGTPSLVAIDEGTVLATWEDESRLWNGDWQPPVPLLRPQPSGRAVRLTDGRVLLVGGVRDGRAIADVELFERDAGAPGGGRWREAAAMNAPRFGPGSILLPNGKVLLVGGCEPALTDSTELFDPLAGTWASGPRLASGRCEPEVAPLRR